MNLVAKKLKALGLQELLLGTAASTLLVMAGCGQVSDLVDATTARSGTFTHVYNNVLTKNCTQCHDGTQSAEYGNVDFSSKTKAYSTLVGQNISGPQYSAGLCAGVPLIVAGEPSQSYFAAILIDELKATNGIGDDPDCVSDTTHLEGIGGYTPTESDATSIKDWITAGAKND